MTRFILSLLLVLGMATSVFADVKGKIVFQDIDDKGAIRVWTTYSVDGVDVESRYPNKVNGRPVFVSGRYSARQFEGMTEQEILERMDADVKAHDENLIRQTYDMNAEKTLNEEQIEYNRKANEAFVLDKLQSLVGRTVSADSTVVRMDTDANGIADKELTIKMDGSKTEKAIAEIAVIPTP